MERKFPPFCQWKMSRWNCPFIDLEHDIISPKKIKRPQTLRLTIIKGSLKLALHSIWFIRTLTISQIFVLQKILRTFNPEIPNLVAWFQLIQKISVVSQQWNKLINYNLQFILNCFKDFTQTRCFSWKKACKYRNVL